MIRFLNILIKSVGILLISAICLLVLSYYALQLKEVQTTLTQKGTEWLSKKLGGNVTVAAVKISWIDEFTFEDVNIKDLEGRDMIYVRELYVNSKTNFSFNYKDIVNFNNNLDYVLLKNPEVKLIKDANGNLNIDFWISQIEKLTQDTTKVSKPNQNTPFTIDNAYIKNGFVSITDSRKARFPKEEFDYYNFRFDNINADLEKVLILGDTIAFKTKSLKAVDYRSDLTINNIKTNFLYCKTAMLLNNLNAKINNSYIGNSLEFYFNKPSDFNDFNEKVRIKANLKNSYLDAKDMGRFSSNMYAFTEKYLLDANLDGTFVNLSFNNFDLKFGKKTHLAGNANFKGFPDLAKTNTTLSLKQGLISHSDLKQYSNNVDFQNYLTKLEEIDLKGTYEGFYNNFKSNLEITSTNLGKLKGKVEVSMGKKSADAKYMGNFEIATIDLGKLTDDPSLNKIDFKGKIKGMGLEIAEASLELDGQISNIDFNGYNFQNITLDGKLGQSIFDGLVIVQDKNLSANVTGKIDFNKELNSFKIKGDIFNADLQNLGITDKKIIIGSDINFDFIGNKLDEWVGRAQFINTSIKDGEKILAVDSMFFNSTVSGNARRYSMISEFFNVYVNGRFIPSNLISDLTETVNEYQLFFNDTENSRYNYYSNKRSTKYLTPYEANYKLFFKNSIPFFNFFSPDFYVSAGSNLEGKFITRSTTEFSCTGIVDTLGYKLSKFYNTNIDFNSSKSAFSQEVLSSIIINSESQQINSDLDTEELNINAYWGKTNSINFDAAIKQKNTNSHAEVFGEINFLNDGFDVKFNPKNSNVVLVKNKWTFDVNNRININDDYVGFENLKLSNNNQSISLNGSIADNTSNELLLTLTDFDLLTLKPFTNEDIKGIANGELRLKDYYNNPFFTSQLNIDELIFRNSLIGTVASKASWDNINEKLNINGNVFRINQEIIRVNGTYNPESKLNPLALNVKLRNLDLQLFDGMLAGTFSELGGQAAGDIEVKGNFNKPIFNGEVNVTRGKLKVDASGTNLFFDDTIVFNERGIESNDKGITLRDALIGGNNAKLFGGVYFRNDGDFYVNIRTQMNDRDGFKVLDTRNADNSSFYGVAYTSGDLNITGDFNNVIINSNLTSKKGTKITIPLDSEKNIDVQEEGIPFLAKKVKNENLKLEDKSSLKIKDRRNDGIKLTFNLSLTQDAECEIIFDRTNNDVLDVFGEGNLSIIYDSRGEFSINGPYVIRSGKYNFSFQNLASLRKFDIVNGSRITWSGDPYEAVLNLEAQYTANIPVSKIPNLENDKNRYPVKVLVSLTDRILTPNISYNVSFDVKQIPIASQTSVLSFEQRLKTDEQLLSRNVSSILVFNDIFPDNITDALSQQFLIDNVSNLLSNQIGNLANKLNPNLELGVQFGDIRSNLLNNMQLNFSYRFLNNRIKLSGKSSFINTLESSINQNSPGQLSVGGEIEYLLSPDGEYKFQLFSRSVPTNYYFSSSGGNVVVSGGNLVISRNFNSFFNKNENRNFPLGLINAKKEEDVELKEETILQ